MSDDDRKESEARLLFDDYVHEDNLVHTRSDWFIIFHAILFEAFVSVKQDALQSLTLGGLGCLASYLWLVVGVREAWLMTLLKRAVRNKSVMRTDLFKRISEARQKGQRMKWAGANIAFCVILPSACLLAWLIVTTAAGRDLWWIVLLVILGGISVFTALWAFLTVREHPRVSREAEAALDPEFTDS